MSSIDAKQAGRAFLKRFACVCAALCVSSAWAQSEPQSVVYDVKGQPYEGQWFEPEEGTVPQGQLPGLVLLVHDWDGLTEYETKRAQMLAALGYQVFAADLFGEGVRPTSIPDRQKCTGELYADRPKMRALVTGALQAAGMMGGNKDNAVAMGYCFGGTAVLEYARTGVELKGFVTFHGGLGLPEGQDYSQTKGKVMIHHGTADNGIPMSLFAALAEDLEKAGVSHEMITYGGAPHAWTVFDSPRYREQADKDSWAHFTRFLDQTLAE